MMLFMDPPAPAYEAHPLSRSFAVLLDDTPTPESEYGAILEQLDDSHGESLAVAWLIWLRDVKRRSENTLLSYNAVLRNYLAWCARTQVDVLNPGLADLEAFMVRRHDFNGRKGSASSQRTDAAVLRGWFSWMHERKLIPANPAKDLSGPAAKRKDGRPIEDEHWQVIWASDLSLRMRAILGLGFYCGLRQEELGALRAENITPTKIRNFVRKGGSEDTLPWADLVEAHHRKLPHLMPDPHVMDAAVAYARGHHDRLIPWQRHKELYRWMSKLCTRVGVPQYTPHQMRHSTATNLLRAGVRPHLVMRLMNHTSFDTTMGYVRAGARDLREFLDGT